MMHTHRGALEYDWRTRFGLPLTAVGTDAMSWSEAVRLAVTLTSDGSSQLAAALGQWRRPFTFTEWAVLDFLDTYRAANSEGKADPVPRPTEKPRTPGMSKQEVDAILSRVRAAGSASTPITVGGARDGG
ncbi:hypothetical protein [Cutibacterium avidum]|nr:hypothetical protein [Cutibacterium avidum]